MITLLTEAGATPAGTCPACGDVMDQSGCRLGARWSSEDPRTSAGIVRVLEVYCAKVPRFPETPAVPTPQQIGTAIQNLREALGHSVRTFAGLANLSAVRLRQIEAGAVEATAAEHRRILRAFGFEVVG